MANTRTSIQQNDLRFGEEKSAIRNINGTRNITEIRRWVMKKFTYL